MYNFGVAKPPTPATDAPQPVPATQPAQVAPQVTDAPQTAVTPAKTFDAQAATKKFFADLRKEKVGGWFDDDKSSPQRVVAPAPKTAPAKTDMATQSTVPAEAPKLPQNPQVYPHQSVSKGWDRKYAPSVYVGDTRFGLTPREWSTNTPSLMEEGGYG
jgi:hypothetical protein